ncbi:MAG: NAD-dependent epimerase/dehydratase family protein [Deltaproteobacteria bacterium]|nr:NAD-dependent epimerase/dehydratase family protein [Deltaproteobacteria bacterium]
MNVVVVGGTGFLGLNIVEAFRDAGHHVVATRRPSSNTIFLRRLKVGMATASLTDVDSLVSVLSGADVVCFAAGHYPRFSIDTTAHVARAVAEVANVLEATRRAGVARFIYTGTVATVGRPREDRPAVETDGTAATPEGSTYIAVKLAMEREIERASRSELDVITLLPTACIGPYDHKVGTGFFLVGLANGLLDVYVDGKINIVDARDVARAHVAAAEKRRRGERFIIGGTNIRVEELFRRVAERFEVAMPSRCLDPEAAIAFAIDEEARASSEKPPGRPKISREMVDLIIHGQFVDSEKAARELAFTVRPLDETIAAAHAWYRANGYLKR